MIGSLVMSIGIGFAFAAMPNLIVESVPPERTGEATGFNQLVRSVGSSLGSQISAAILAGSVVAGAPTDAGYTAAFVVSAGVALAAGIVSALIPRAGGGAQGRARGRAGMTRADAVRNRAAVLAAAEAVFAEHGTDAGVDLVAERAGVGKATVYRSFPTKEALVAEVVSRQLDTWLAANAGAEGDAMTVLRRLLRAAAEAKVLGEGTGLASLAVARERWLATLEAILARADGSVRADATAEEVTTLFGGVCRVLASRGGGRPGGVAPPRRARRRRLPPLAVRQPSRGAQPFLGGGRRAFQLLQAGDAGRARAVHPGAIEREPVAVVARLVLEVAEVRRRGGGGGRRGAAGATGGAGGRLRRQGSRIDSDSTPLTRSARSPVRARRCPAPARA